MANFTKRVFNFIKENPSVLYSLVLIIFLPVILWWNTSFTVRSFEKNIDFILQKQALTIENIIGEIVGENIDDSEVLQKKIEKIAQENPEIKNLKVIRVEGDEFSILASQKKEEVGKRVSEPSLALAWHQNQNIAYLRSERGERFWNLIKPISRDGKKIALLNLSLSLKSTDVLIAKNVRYSFLIVLFAILVSLILVFQHTRLFEYMKLYKELRKIEQLRESFFRMAIHELQSPIVNIRGYIETLKEEIGPILPFDQRENLKRISVSARNLSDLVYDILAVVKIEQGALDLTPKLISPSDLIQEVINGVIWKAKEKGLQIVHQRKELGYKINVNPNRFREILQNLLENAIKYTPEGKIEIKEWVDGKREIYYISVEDTGIGISGEEQKRIFEKFYRVKNRETAGIPGTGLGLWIVKSLCQKMGGDIVVESIKGVGSKFTIFFKAIKS